MELNTRLDRGRYRWNSPDLSTDDRASLLVDVTAPALPDRERTAATNLVVVLDRSGSMGGGRLTHAKRALRDVVDRLSPGDTFGLITFDDEVEVVVPAGPVTDRDRIKRAVDGVSPRGSTDLGAGLLRGLKEARRLEATEGVRVLLISDGHANRGATDADVLGARTAEFIDQRITTSTLGMGLGYDEVLLDAISRSGAGNQHFAEEADTAAGAIGSECGELLGQRFLQCRLTVTRGNGVRSVSVLNDATVRPFGDGVSIELGNLAPEQSVSLVLQFDPKPAPKPGRRKVATVRLAWVLADDLSDQSTSQTVWARVAAPGERPGRFDREVTSEVVFQRVQRRKRRAAQALAHGAVDEARHHFDRALSLVRRHWDTIPRERRDEFTAEIDSITEAVEQLDRFGQVGASRASKTMFAASLPASRKRDRRRPQ